MPDKANDPLPKAPDLRETADAIARGRELVKEAQRLPAVLILAARWVSPKGHTSLERALVSYSRWVESDSALAWRCSTAC